MRSDMQFTCGLAVPSEFVFPRFFARAWWNLDALGRMVFRLALYWVPPNQPLGVLVDDTLACDSWRPGA